MTETPLEFPDGELITGAEVAFGADLTADPSGWDWTDLSDRLMDQSVSITRGRQDETSQVTPTIGSVTLDNPDGWLTPDNGESPYWPYVDLGNPGRAWVKVGTARLFVPPDEDSRAHIVSAAALNITDIDIRVDLMPLSMPALTADSLITGVVTSQIVGRGIAWRLLINQDRTLTLRWASGQTATSPPMVPHRSRVVVRVTLDVNNGSGQHVITWYTGETVDGAFTQVGEPEVRSGTTTVASQTGDLEVGQPSNIAVDQALHAEVYAFKQLSTLGGAVIVDATFEGQPDGTTTFVDDAGRTWLIDPPAELSNRHFRITGTTDKWAPGWPYGDLSAQQVGGLGDGEARSTVTLSGLLRRLQRPDTAGSPIRSSTIGQSRVPIFPGSLSSRVAAYWPMEDEVGSATISAVVGQSVSALPVDLAQVDGLPGSKPVLAIRADTSLPLPVSATGSAWQLDWYMFIETAPGVLSPLLAVQNENLAGISLLIDATDIDIISTDSGGGAIFSDTLPLTDFFGKWQHMKLWVTAGGEWELSYEPVEELALPTSVDGIGANVAPIHGISILGSAGLAGAGYGHMLVYNDIDVSDIDGAGLAWVGETAGDRIARIAQEQGVDFRIIGDPDTSALMGPQEIGTGLEVMRSSELADGGVLQERRDALGLVYRTRSSFYNQPANLTLDALVPEIQNPMTPTRDDQRVKNQVTASRTGGGFFVASDQEKITRWGLYPSEVTVNVESDSQLADIAGWELHKGVQPRMRYPGVSSNVALWDTAERWLIADIGDRVVVDNLPPQHPGDADVVMEGYTETLSPQSMDMTANCSPAEVWSVAQVDAPEEGFLFRADTAGSRLAEAIDTTEDELLVTTTRGPLWRPGVPTGTLDIGVGGEQIRVADIDAAAGNQVLTTATRNNTANASAQIAESVTALGSADLLICAWRSSLGTYTAPGSMVEQDETTDGVVSTMMDATQTLGAAGATGTRTATFSLSQPYQSVTLAVTTNQGATTPVTEEYFSDLIAGSASGDMTFELDPTTQAGWWVVAIAAKQVGTAAPRSTNLGTVLPTIAEVGSGTTPRMGIYAFMVAKAGSDQILFPGDPGNPLFWWHGRVYVLSGITDVSQLFTVTRSINGVVKSHAAGTPVSLWRPTVLGR